ncbi:MAG: hypothetical protein [Cressdnaviricota sp.]|nr:MAG: hypothetical protein [Cressdnaviricota sp.]
MEYTLPLSRSKKVSWSTLDTVTNHGGLIRHKFGFSLIGCLILVCSALIGGNYGKSTETTISSQLPRTTWTPVPPETNSVCEHCGWRPCDCFCRGEDFLYDSE